ncbi:hypothetical protein CBR_g41694 [Chara braunii]|uniref:Calcium-dependent protein kinase n=1 Tax=Chara braunii TaxID=69332 RepID=A0A388LWI4_CHABU|nr:hypothetical protein CBR_g41694 [Chara braunii]|eukprot:GBG86631.1 hypothetical protein CBR_g41694 [Chara braunii]
MGNNLSNCWNGKLVASDDISFSKAAIKEKKARRKHAKALRSVLPSQLPFSYGKSSGPGKYVLGVGYRDVHRFYDIGKEIGRGMFGVTRLAVDKRNGEEFACKTISKKWLRSKDHFRSIRREEEILRHLEGHPNIARLVESFEDNQAVHFILELCRGGMLYDRVTAKGFYTEQEAASMTRQIVEVVKHLHTVGVMHRDLKLENFLLADHREDSPVKTIDFGERFSELVGSAYYVAPEVIAKDYGPEADIWSAGVILYMLLSGAPPFYDVSEEGILGAVKRGVFDLQSDPWPLISDQAKDLVKGMLKVKPTERLTVDEILNHEWLRKDGCASNDPITCPVLSRIKQFMMMNKLKRLAYNVIVEASLNAEERDSLQKQFQDKTGFITAETLKEVLNDDEMMDCVRDIIHEYDTDKDGRIDFEEFAAMMQQGYAEGTGVIEPDGYCPPLSPAPYIVTQLAKKEAEEREEKGGGETSDSTGDESL